MKEPCAAVHLGNLQKVLRSAKEEPHGAGSPRASQELAAERQPRAMSRGGDLSPAPLQWPPHPSMPAEALGESRTQHGARRLRGDGGVGVGSGEACAGRKKDARSFPRHSQPDPRQPPLPSCTLPPTGQGLLKVALRRSPQGQVPLLPKVWSWPYSQPQPQDAFVCFPAGKWKPAPAPPTPRPRGGVCFASWRLGLVPGFFTDALDVFSP